MLFSGFLQIYASYTDLKTPNKTEREIPPKSSYFLLNLALFGEIMENLKVKSP